MKKLPQHALIIGNGTSRLDFDLEKRSVDYITFGCNALYRELPWNCIDWLIAIDHGIATEIADSNFPLDRFIYPPPAEQYEPAELSGRRQVRSNAGMNAMIEAIRRGFIDLTCIGFDFILYDPIQSTSNVFEGSNNYGPETHASVDDNVGRIRYLSWFINHNLNVRFNFAVPLKCFMEIKNITSPIAKYFPHLKNVKIILLSDV